MAYLAPATASAPAATARSALTAPVAVCQNGVIDYVLHPMEPLAVRLTIAATF